MNITAQSHPTIFKAFQLIDLDSGAINRFEPPRIEYEIPTGWDANLTGVEAGLNKLSDGELDTLCTGELEMAREIESKYELGEASLLLSAYFREFEEEV